MAGERRHGLAGNGHPRAYRGAGFGFIELVVLLQEMGRALYPSPFFSSVILGAFTLLESADEGAQGSCSGDRIGGAQGDDGSHRAGGPLGRDRNPSFEALPDSGEWVLGGPSRS